MSTQSNLIAINAPTPVQAPYRASYPLEITAMDVASGQSLLYITGNAGRSLQITIKNASLQDYTIPKLTGSSLSDTNYQLAIDFRPGILNTQTLSNLKISQTNWTLSYARQSSGVDTIYVQYGDDITLKAGDEISFTMESVMADGTMGARSTKVEFSYRNLQPASGGNPLSGTLSQVMQVINAEGLNVSPFYFGVYGSRTILNDGQTSNDVRLVLAAAGQSDVPIAIDSSAPTIFELGFVESASDQNIPWALCPNGMINANNITVSIEGNTDQKWECAPVSNEGDRILFTITTTDTGIKSIAVNQPLIINIKGITTNYSNGLSPVTLNYFNVPGYRDGAMTTWLEKRESLTTNKVIPGGGSPNGLELGNFQNNDDNQWPNVSWLRNLSSTGEQWDEGFIKVGKVKTHFGHGGFGLHTIGYTDKNKIHRKEVGFYTSGFTPMLIVEGETGNTYIRGKLGIGTPPGKPDDSSAELEVNGPISIPYPKSATNGLLIGQSQVDSKLCAGLFISTPSNPPSDPFQICYEDNKAIFCVNTQGLVGIGTNSPSRGQIDINGRITNPISNYGWLNGGTGATTTVVIDSHVTGDTTTDLHVGTFSTTNTKLQFSIWASGNIASPEFDAFSDARIKEIQGPSDSTSDLTILNKIQITDYRYKDRAQYGGRPHKKVIGQQVADVFPQAITTHTDVVPDILAIGTMENGFIALEGNTLKKGEKVRILFESSQPELLEVLESTDQGFTVDSKKSGEVVIYGREVDDFHNVDYDAISMLNVSATQELYKLVQEQAKLIKEQGAMIRELQAEVQALKRGAVSNV